MGKPSATPTPVPDAGAVPGVTGAGQYLAGEGHHNETAVPDFAQPVEEHRPGQRIARLDLDRNLC